MKNVVLKYGTISGLIGAALMFTTVLIQKKYGFASNSELLGYLGIALSFIPMFLGVRKFRETEGGGSITFWKALSIGVVIMVVSGIFYALSWLIIYYKVTPDFPEKYAAFAIEQMKTTGKDLKDTVLVKQQMAQYREMARNPFVLGALTFTEPLPLGLIMSLICAAILRKKPPTIELGN